MAKRQNKKEMPAASRDHAHNLRKLAEQVSHLGTQVTNIANRLSIITGKFESLNDSSADLPARKSSIVKLGHESAFTERKNHSLNNNTGKKILSDHCKIIPFEKNHSPLVSEADTNDPAPQFFKAISPFLAAPGIHLPMQIADFRPVLQRDGLILLAWDMRKTEMGDRYTAYWVTSIGIPRFSASKLLPLPDFPSARPDHKSYAAEDGIEFYGQEAPLYMVHVAPELMMSNPQHRELRQAHINTLKEQGVTVDFNYKYLLSSEKHQYLPHRKAKHESRHQAV